MNEPRDLVGMADEIRGELRADDEIDRLAVGFAQIDQPPRRGMRENFALRIPLERNADELGLIPVARAAADGARERGTRRRHARTEPGLRRRRRVEYPSVRGHSISPDAPINYPPCLHRGGARWLPRRCSSAFCSMPALLRLDALFKSYGPYDQPRWLAAMQPAVASGGLDDHARLAVAPRSQHRMWAAIRSTT